MPISFDTNVKYLKLGENLIPVKKTDTDPAKVYISFRGTTVASKEKYPDRAIRAKEKDGGDFYNPSTTLEWEEGENDIKYAKIEVFKQDNDRNLAIYGSISVKEGTSTLDPEGFKNTLFITPEKVSDIEDYVAETIEEATGDIFSQERTPKQVRLRVLNNGKPYPAGIKTERQNTSVSELGTTAHISVNAKFTVEKLPKNPKLELVLPVSNGENPVVLPSFIKQKWWLKEPENLNSKPKDISDPVDKTASDNLLLPANSNIVRVPLEVNKKYLSTNDSLIFWYPLDEIKYEGDNQYIEEKISSRNGILIEEDLSDDVERTISVIELDGKSTINFNKHFHFLVTDPSFITPEIQEFSVSLWYHVSPQSTGYNQFCDGRYTNNQNYMFIDLYGTAGRHNVMIGGYGGHIDSHLYYQSEMDSQGSGWFHYTWTRNTKTGINNYYVNGVLTDVLRNRLYPISQAGRQVKSMKIGKRNNALFTGNVVDFKGYNKELTPDEVMASYLSNKDTTFEIGGSIEVNLNGLAVKNAN